MPNTGFIVLDHDLIMLPDNDTWSMVIYYIPPSSVGGQVKLIQRLKLPTMRNPSANTIRWAKCRSVPNPTGDGLFPKYVPPSVPFISRPELALAHFRWEILTPEDEEMYSLIFHRNSITKLLPSRNEWLTTTPADVESLAMNWDEWGPRISLWRHTGGRQRGMGGLGHTATTNGQYHIYSVPDVSQFSIEDYNIYHVRRYNREIPEEFEDEHILEGETFLPPVVTYLPYFEVTSEEYDYDYVYITDGIIVGTNVSSSFHVWVLGNTEEIVFRQC